MTERQWMTSRDPREMLGWVLSPSPNHPRPSKRQMAMFATACRLAVTGDGGLWWHPLPEPDKTLNISRDFYLDASERMAMRVVVHPLYEEHWGRFADILRDIIGNPYKPTGTHKLFELSHRMDQSENAVFGDLKLVPPTWITPVVSELARLASIASLSRCKRCARSRMMEFHTGLIHARVGCTSCYYTGQVEDGTIDVGRIRALLDALEDAGCDNPLIIDHLRVPVYHVSGCWAIEMVIRA